MFRAVGSKVKFPGFMKVYVEGNDDGTTDEEKFLPPLHRGRDGPSRSGSIRSSISRSRRRDIRKLGLSARWKKSGIGRPSTYAPTLETIQKRGYVAMEEKKFVPTELGDLVIQLMEEFFPEILDAEFTAHMEDDLDHVEEGKEDWVQRARRISTSRSRNGWKSRKKK